jgi:hypothetical protein
LEKSITCGCAYSTKQTIKGLTQRKKTTPNQDHISMKDIWLVLSIGWCNSQKLSFIILHQQVKIYGEEFFFTLLWSAKIMKKSTIASIAH